MGRSTSTSASRNELFIGLLTAVLVFLMAARTPLDSDLFWHLRAGSDALDTARPVLVDTYSYTRAGQTWVNHSWLGQVVLALVYRLAGWTGLAALVAGLAAGSMFLLYRRMAGPFLWRAFMIVLGALVVAPVWSPRPQIFSLFLLVILDGLLLSSLNLRAKAAWTAVLFVIWSNLHGGYVLGLLLLVCRACGILLDRWTGREPGSGREPVLFPLGLGLAGFLLAAVNPNGMAMWRVPFQTVGVGALQTAIPEWASPDFHDLTQQPFLWLLAALLLAFGLSGRPVGGFDLVKTVLFAMMGLAARRNFGPFGLLALLPLADYGWTAVIASMPRIRFQPRAGGSISPGLQRALNLIIFFLLALAAAGKLAVVSHPAAVAVYLPAAYPAGAVEFLRERRPEGRLFSTYAWGGFLIWALPGKPVFVDGRTDLYGDEIIGQWLSILALEPPGEGRPGWQQLLDRWQADLVLVEPGQPLARALHSSGWQVLYSDTTSILLERSR